MSTKVVALCDRKASKRIEMMYAHVVNQGGRWRRLRVTENLIGPAAYKCVLCVRSCRIGPLIEALLSLSLSLFYCAYTDVALASC